MFKTTTVTLTLAAIATVAVNLQAPVFAAEPTTDPIATETPAVPGSGSLTVTAPTLDDALADYLAGLGPEEDDFGGPAEVATLPDDVIGAIRDSVVDLPGLSELPPLTTEGTEPAIDEPVCGEPGGICDEPDEGAELPLDPTDVCGDEGVACEFDPTVDDEGMPFDDESVPVDETGATDDNEIPFGDHGRVGAGRDEAPVVTPVNRDTSEIAVPTTTVAEDAAMTAATDDGGTTEGADPVSIALISFLAATAVAGLGYGALRMGRRGA
jgi:hypothetical protein